MITNNLMRGGYLARRRRFMKGNNKPYDAEVEYLEVNAEGGHAWIDTGYVPNVKDIDIYTSIHIISTGTLVSGYPFIGCMQTEVGYAIFAYTRNYVVFINGTKPTWNNNIAAIIGEKVNIEILGSKRIWRVKNKDEEGSLGNYNTNHATNEKTFLIGNSDYIPYMRIYSLKIIEEDKTIFDLIPVRVGSEGYMYDRVSGKLFGNSGTGRFILGHDVNQ